MATIETETALAGGTVGANVGNIDVISMLPNNTVLEAIKTDAGGNGTIKVYPGGSVTAVYKHTVDQGADLITYVGVKPGDTLVFGSRNFSQLNQPNPALGSMTYTWPVQTGVTNHCVYTSCGGSCNGVQTSTTLTEYPLCNRSPMDVLFIGYGSTGYISHFRFFPNQTFTAGGTIANNGWIAAGTAMVNITGLPAEVSNVSGSWSPVIDNATDYNFSQGYSGTPTGGAFTGSFTFGGTGDRTLARVVMTRAGNFQQITLADQFGSNTLSQTVASPTLPPWMQGTVLASAALRSATWYLVGDASSVSDGVVLRLAWNHVVASANNYHQWHVIMPPGQQSIDLPKLPAAFNDNLPAPQDGLSGQVRTFDVNTATGYDALRAVPSRNIMCIDCALRAGDFQRAVYSGGFVN